MRATASVECRKRRGTEAPPLDAILEKGTPMTIDRTPRRQAEATLLDTPGATLDMPAKTIDLAGDSPSLSGRDIMFTGDDGTSYLLRTSEILGAGAQGTVVRAIDERGAQFAAKISWLPRSAKDRMNRAAVLAFLRSLMKEHPLRERHFEQTHIMPVFATGQIRDEVAGMGETVYDVAIMPVCDTSLEGRTDVSFEEIRTLILPQAAAALKTLHEKRIVHRDVKPKNLYMLDGRIVLGDFGISSVLDVGRDTGSTKIDRRTPGYSPHSSVVQRENDWYSLGYTVWTLYNDGRHPHQALIDADDLSSVLAGGRPVPFAAKAPAHESLGQLIFGLTYASSMGRLGFDDVMSWCGNPLEFSYADPAPRTAASSARRRAYQFEGSEYTDRKSLAAALCSRWERAKRHLYTHALEEHFRSTGQTDLAVALNDIVETDRATIADHDLGLCRALFLIDPHGPAFRWKGRSFEPNGLAAFCDAAGDRDALAFVSSGALSRWAKDSNAPAGTARILRSIEADARTQAPFVLSFIQMRFSGGAPELRGARTVDACFASLSRTPAWFYDQVRSDSRMHELAGFLAAIGLFSQAELFDRTLGDGDAMTRAGRLLALFDDACTDKDAVRSFNARFGPLGHVRWVARNIRSYEARSEAARELLARISSAPDCSRMPVARSLEALAQAEDALIALRGRMAESPYMARLGMAGDNEDVFARNADAYFTADFLGRCVPRGYVREIADASGRDPEAAAFVRRMHVRRIAKASRDRAAEKAAQAAQQLKKASAAQAEAKTADGRGVPLAVASLIATTALILLVATFWPHLTMVLHVANMEGNVGGLLASPIARTSTLSVLAFAGFLMAACASMSYRVADLALVGRKRAEAEATAELARRVEAEGRAIATGTDETTGAWERESTTMPAALGIDAQLRACASLTPTKAHARGGASATMFWTGIALASVSLFALTVGWLPYQTVAGNLGIDFDPSILQVLYLAAAIAAFALAAGWANKTKGMPGACVMCLTPTAGAILAYAVVAAATLAIGFIVLCLIVAVIGAIFR